MRVACQNLQHKSPRHVQWLPQALVAGGVGFTGPRAGITDCDDVPRPQARARAPQELPSKSLIAAAMTNVARLHPRCIRARTHIAANRRRLLHIHL